VEEELLPAWWRVEEGGGGQARGPGSTAPGSPVGFWPRGRKEKEEKKRGKKERKKKRKKKREGKKGKRRKKKEREGK
jgi:hypothetical protein